MTPLVIAFTPNYFVPAAVTLKSLSMSSDPDSRYEIICLVSEDIPQHQKDMLNRLAGNNMSFKYINLAGRLEGMYVDPRYSEAASYRLLLPEILPEYDTIAYIDCDVVVRNDIDRLFHQTDLSDFLLAAVYEAPIEGQAERWEALGCDPNSYFNSGFLLMNLKLMRSEKTCDKLMDALRVDYLEFPDQDALNQVCKGRVFPLHPVFNSIRTFFLPQYKENFLQHYLPEDWDEVQAHGTIHYTGGKPWNLFTIEFGQWWDVYDKLPAEIKKEWCPSNKIRIIASIYSCALGKAVIDLSRNTVRRMRHSS